MLSGQRLTVTSFPIAAAAAALVSVAAASMVVNWM